MALFVTYVSCARSVDSPNACIYAEIRTRIPETISWDYNFEPAGSTPLTFTVKVSVLFISVILRILTFLNLQLYPLIW